MAPGATGAKIVASRDGACLHLTQYFLRLFPAAALIDTLALALGPAFTPEVRAAWTTVYGIIQTSMIQGAVEGGDPEELAKLGYPVHGKAEAEVEAK